MLRRLFYRIFPVPLFLRMPAVGIDISDEVIRFAAVKEKHTGLEIDKFGEYKLPKGVVVKGKIQNIKVLQEYLMLIKKEHGFCFANIALPEEKAYVVRLQIPQMNKKEIRGNIELQFEEHVPMLVSEAVFDYSIIKENSKKIDIHLSVAPRSMSEVYLEAISGAGIMSLGFEIEPEAIARAVVPRNDKGTFMVIDFERAKTGISIVSENVTQFTTSLHIGDGELIKTAIKKTEESSVLQKQKTQNELIKEQVFLSLIPTLERLRDEINKNYIYWQSHDDQYGKPRQKIEKLILCGEGAVIPGIAEYLSAGIQATVQLADVIVNVRSSDMYIPEMEYAESFKYTTAIGLALAHKNT